MIIMCLNVMILIFGSIMIMPFGCFLYSYFSCQITVISMKASTSLNELCAHPSIKFLVMYA